MSTSRSAADPGPASLSGAHHRTLEAIFRHPAAHNLEWRALAGLIGEIGAMHEKSNNEYVFEAGGKRFLMRKPHTKDLTSDEVTAVRRFLAEAGWSPSAPSQPPVHPDPAAPDLLIVVDHHQTRLFQVDAGAAQPAIRPYDPHHFLHHLTHKDQDRERGQRAPEEPAYYEAIAKAAALGGRIVVVGHGKGHSNAAHHLVEVLKAHHREVYGRVVREIEADLSAISDPQLLDLAKAALRD
jgi:hypothetical protein